MFDSVKNPDVMSVEAQSSLAPRQPMSTLKRRIGARQVEKVPRGGGGGGRWVRRKRNATWLRA
jgi:hypothetical protein